MEWYYSDGKKQLGPVNNQEFKALVKNKTIISGTLIWRQGMKDWEELGRVVKQGSIKTREKEVLPDAIPESACTDCGRDFPEDELIRFENSKICADCKPAFVQKLKEGVSQSGGMVYAGFWIRCGAKIIDGIIMVVINMIVFIPAGIAMSTSDNPTLSIGLSVIVQILNIAIPAVYTTWFIGRFNATPGKMACGIKVVTADNDPIGYPRALGRHFAEWISAMILGIGYIMAAFDDEKRTLHDRICNTRVVFK